MHWWGGGLITIIIYGGFHEGTLQDNTIITENNFDILTENSLDLLTET